ncbi:MAG: hydrolase 2, exosortase A system-associated [Gammaproteobacteria bacterium]
MDRSSELLGAMPEMDSMTVLAVITALEEHFDFIANDTEFDPKHFESVGALLDFIDEESGGSDRALASSGMSPEFLELPSGRLFALRQIPTTPGSKPVVLLCPPFAEELNKSRRQISIQARAFRDAGYPVVVFDLYGTGDSEGSFVDASVKQWQENFQDVLRWLKAAGHEACILWAIRFGALFVDDIITSEILPVKKVLLWQPEFSGNQVLRQFLRLQAAANMFSNSKGMSVADLEAQLMQGNSVEVAGYGISSNLYTEAKQLKLANTQFGSGIDVTWLHVLSAPQTSPPERVKKLAAQWQSHQSDVELIPVEGANFWSPADLVVIPELVEKSIEAVTKSKTSSASRRLDQHD